MVSSLHTVTPSLQTLPYDPIGDFAPITRVAYSPLILVAHPSVPANSVRDLISLAKEKPGQLSFGSAGNGSPSHLAGEAFKAAAGVEMIHVPFKGAGQATSDLVGGHISLIFNNPLSTIPLLKNNSVKAIAVTSAQRSRAVPEIPTIVESGLPGFEITSWWGVLAPPKTPPEVVTKLNGAFTAALRAPDVSSRLAEQGVEPNPDSPDQFAAFIKADVARWGKLVREAGIKAD
jgi:tripartite-type tricarboxylate transporter receptor subunit TctC